MFMDLCWFLILYMHLMILRYRNNNNKNFNLFSHLSSKTFECMQSRDLKLCASPDMHCQGYNWEKERWAASYLILRWEYRKPKGRPTAFLPSTWFLKFHKLHCCCFYNLELTEYHYMYIINGLLIGKLFKVLST